MGRIFADCFLFPHPESLSQWAWEFFGFTQRREEAEKDASCLNSDLCDLKYNKRVIYIFSVIFSLFADIDLSLF